MMSLPDEKWNIGVDLIVYRDGNDSMGFHSDDNQGETSVLALVVECKEARPVYIRPHRNVARAEGDEEVQLFVRQGDAYELDAGCQAGYEHSLPKRAQSKERRMVAIFKQGIPTTVDEDSGVCVVENTNASINRYPWLKKKVDPLKPANRRAPVTFGHISGFAEGSIASRMKLYLGRMCNDQRGVSGNVTLGVDALVFSRNDFTLGEKDGFYWLCYVCKRSEGGGGLNLSYLTGKPVRVLRSSNLKASQFAPLNKDAKSIAACYRYDGLYTIIKVYDTEGRATHEAPGPKSGDKHPQFTYVLQRNPTVKEVYEYEFTANEPYQLGEFAYFSSDESANCNVKSATELWNEIQISGGVSELQEIPRKLYGPDWE
ncbi:hypothetical protein TrST_g3156 [Triparma strigata]|uniref:Fe2OG dioxygenase domain-containing protein n=1 Tax=Triparma strigata TaxID=1606541 RepID=A0A9W7C772_9STRA|nr:hypothetical protein TrST_g3156 [Triparma strigata]